MLTTFLSTPVPPLDLLDHGPRVIPSAAKLALLREQIEECFGLFNVDASVQGVTYGPRLIQFQVLPGAGVPARKILALQQDLALCLGCHATISVPAGASFVAVDVARDTPQPVALRDVLEAAPHDTMALPIGVGQDAQGHPVVFDLAAAPHLLIAGTTGAGKSVAVNTLLTSLLLTQPPERLRLLLVDPKRVELTPYDGLPHLHKPVVVEPRRAIVLLNWAVQEMERRYAAVAAIGCRSIAEYTRQGGDMPYLVIVLDELADLMLQAKKMVEPPLVRLAQMARAVGIHLVVATQRPTVNVITGLIKANFPTRMAFQVAQRIDSQVILDQRGAEALLGKGDMLFQAPGAVGPERVQGALVTTREVERVTNYWRFADGISHGTLW